MKIRRLRAYKTAIFLCEAVASYDGDEVDKFEEFGRRVDEELAKIRNYVENEVAPETERRTASFLREAAKNLEEAAAKVEARIAGRRPVA
jgi:hypothetical protein